MSAVADQVEEFIPDADAVATPTSDRATYRFSGGKIVMGREEDGTLSSLEKIVGRLRRLSIHSGTGKQTGIPYSQLEVDIETSRGMVRLKASLTDMKGNSAPSTSALSFAEGLLELGKDELFIATARSSTKKNRFQSYSTYANLFHFDGKNSRATRRRPIDHAVTMDQQWARLEEELKTHPAYAERPKTESETEDAPETELTLLIKDCIAKGWPTPEQQPGVWCQMFAKALSLPKVPASLAEWTEEQTKNVRLALESRKDCPGPLQPFQKKEHDPFG
jgi:hypothetical protein